MAGQSDEVVVVDVPAASSDDMEGVSDATQSPGYPTSEEVQRYVNQVLQAVADLDGDLVSYADASHTETTVVTADDWERFVTLSATGLHAQVVTVGLLALILGAIVGVAMTLHWSVRRG